jgi:hypothetical protein
MPTTYEKIATTTLGSDNSTITFSTIPATYTDLRLVLTGIGGDNQSIIFNGSTASNYSSTRLEANGTTVSSNRDTANANIYLNYTYTASSTIPALYEVDIFNYAGSTFKTCLISSSLDKNGSGSVNRFVGLWRSTSAITSLTLTAEFGIATFKTGTTATLYGILKA